MTEDKLLELLTADRPLTTEEIQAIRVEFGMNPTSDVIEPKTGEARETKHDDGLKTHWDIIESLK